MTTNDDKQGDLLPARREEPRRDLAASAPSGRLDRVFELAADEKLDADKLQKLLDMHHAELERQRREEFNLALAEFQRNCPPIPKDQKKSVPTRGGGSYVIEWTSLDMMVRTVRPVAIPLGLSFTWDAEERDDGKMTIVCHLEHIGGHVRSTRFTLSPGGTPTMSAMQQQRSAWSYGRRITLESALGLISAGEDDDGGGPVIEIEPIKEDQIEHLKQLCDESMTDPEKFLAWLAAPSWERVRADQYEVAVRQLKAKIMGGSNP